MFITIIRLIPQLQFVLGYLLLVLLIQFELHVLASSQLGQLRVRLFVRHVAFVWVAFNMRCLVQPHLYQQLFAGAVVLSLLP
jgi:hypothetical protein